MGHPGTQNRWRLASPRYEASFTLDDTPHTEMTTLYYQHGFNELGLAVRDLLYIVDIGLGVPDS